MKGNKYLDDLKSTIKNSGHFSTQMLNNINRCYFHRLPKPAQIHNCRASLIRLLIIMKLFAVTSIHQLFSIDLAKLLPFGKDVVYKIQNNPYINWRNLLIGQAMSCLGSVTIDCDATDPANVPCLIVDDTDLLKRGKCMEMISRIFSHKEHKSLLGYKCLNLILWTGKNVLHVDFSIHAEKGKKGTFGLKESTLKKRYTKLRDKLCPGFKRITECLMKKTIVAKQMIQRAIRKGFKARYILADSWFFCQDLLSLAMCNRLDIISRPKFNNWKYEYQGKSYQLHQILKKFKAPKNRKYCRKMRLQYFEVKVFFKGNAIKLMFYKPKSRGSKWQALATTDLSLPAIRAYQIYQNRWAIETSYKELKQHLQLGKCQSRDFDAQIADTTQVLMTYNFLSEIKAVNQHESIGGLFRDVSSNWISPTVMQNFWNHVFALIQMIAQTFKIPLIDIIDRAEEMDQFFQNFSANFYEVTAET